MSHSHTPPVPQGNQSPYPLQEPAHPPAAEKPTARRSDRAEPRSAKNDRSHALAIGAAIGIGAAALALAAGVFLLEDRAGPKKNKTAKRKSKPAPKPKPKKTPATSADAE